MDVPPPAAGTIASEPYGTARDGSAVSLHTLRNARGTTVRFIDYGGIVTAIETRDRAGCFADVVLGCGSLADYEVTSGHFGALTGRYANRIGGARFVLNGREYRLDANNGPNTLHGGRHGLDKLVWSVAPDPGLLRAELSCTSPDGDQGFPGKLDVRVTYALSEDDAFAMTYEARTDRDTVLNLTNHTYWNLAGNGSGSIADHIVLIDADSYTPVDAVLIPTGEIASVAGTPLDFRKPTPIGARIASTFPQMLRAHGYDHNYVLNKPTGALGLAARVHDPKTGRILEVLTTEPGMQFYSGNFLDGSVAGSAGVAYRQTAGFALETQHFPDSPNRPEFPSTVLKPGEVFRSATVFRFGTDAP